MLPSADEENTNETLGYRNYPIQYIGYQHVKTYV
jgi:hypothetical protein